MNPLQGFLPSEKDQAAAIRTTTGALKVVLQYALFATLWILLSDEVVGLMVKDPAQVLTLSILKGVAFVAITSLLLFVQVRRFGIRLAIGEQELRLQQAAKAEVELALRENETLFQALAEGASDAFFVHDGAGRFVTANQKACTGLGYSYEELMRLGVQDVDPIAGGGDFHQQWQQVPEGQPMISRSRHRRKDGSTFPVDIRTSAFQYRDRTLYIALVRDLSDTEKAAEALQESESRFIDAFQFMPLGLGITRLRDGQIITVNEAFLQIYGYSQAEIASTNVWDLGIWEDPRDRQIITEALGRGDVVLNREVRARKKGGIPILIAYSGKIVPMQGEPCLLSAALDITEFRRAEQEHARLEAEIQHAQKLESLGSLASGVAHDMNNVLAAIQAVAEVLRSNPALDGPALHGLDTIAKASNRGRDLVRGLTNFARKDLEEPVRVDLNRIVQDEAQLLDRTLLQKIKLVLELEEPLAPIMGEPGALGNALMNLCVNAVDAMPQGGSLTLRTRSLGPDRVELVVQDTGHGMSPEVSQRALEPFFTTKPAGKGTGLGLAMVHGIVRAHGGTLQLHSEVGSGTSLRLQFPALVAGPNAAGASPILASATSRSLRILLVDDDELIRASVPALLAVHGHQASTADSGQAALSHLSDGLQVDLVILDLNMPDLGGAETLAQLRALRPELPVLIATGYLDTATSEFLDRHTGVMTISKPFTLEDLNTKLKELCP